MTTTHHMVDNQGNILHLGHRKNGWHYSVIGLSPKYWIVKDSEGGASLIVTSTCEKNNAAIS